MFSYYAKISLGERKIKRSALRPRIKPGVSKMSTGSANHSTTTFSRTITNHKNSAAVLPTKRTPMMMTMTAWRFQKLKILQIIILKKKRLIPKHFSVLVDTSATVIH